MIPVGRDIPQPMISELTRCQSYRIEQTQSSQPLPSEIHRGRRADDSGKGEMFLADSGDDTVSVISGQHNNTVVATVPVRRQPS